jgi:hypothetical protein
MRPDRSQNFGGGIQGGLGGGLGGFGGGLGGGGLGGGLGGFGGGGLGVLGGFGGAFRAAAASPATSVAVASAASVAVSRAVVVFAAAPGCKAPATSLRFHAKIRGSRLVRAASLFSFPLHGSQHDSARVFGGFCWNARRTILSPS